MVAYYLDSSGLAKRYAREMGTVWVTNITDPKAGNELFISLITGAEEVIRTADIYLSPELLEEYREVAGELLVEEKITRAQWQALVTGSEWVSVSSTWRYTPRNRYRRRDRRNGRNRRKTS